MQPFRIREKTKAQKNTDVSVNYRKHFTDFITFPFTITCCYMYSVQDVLNTLGVVVSLSTHVQHPSNLSGFLDSFSTEEVIIPQVTAPNTPTLFFHTQPGCSFPHTFPLRFILLTIFCCHYSVNKKWIGLKIRHWPCLLPGEQINVSYAGKSLPHT